MKPGVNQVPVDEAAVHAELRELGADLSTDLNQTPPGAPGVPTAPPADPPTPMDWRLAASGIVLIIDKVACPNWELESEEKDALAGGAEQVLAAFFPTTNIDPRVQALLALGGIVTAIAAKRIDYATRTIKPLRRAKPAKPGSSMEDGYDDTAGAPAAGGLDRAAA